MLKSYVMSFLAMTYYPLLTIPTVAIFVIFFFFSSKLGTAMKPIAGVFAVVLGGVLLVYNLDKYRLKKQVREIKNAKEYDNAVMLGNSFLLEKRMLAYAKRNLKEYTYDSLKKVLYGKDKKGKDQLTLEFAEGTVVLPVGSYAQAARTAAFLKTVSDAVPEGIEPEGTGRLHAIDMTENN